MQLLGLDIGSSSVKASLIEGSTGECLGSAFYPKHEMRIDAPQAGWAEQSPELWWENLKLAVAEVLSSQKAGSVKVGAIGISYQMHGLVVVDKDRNVLRPSIIWCDSRAATIGQNAFDTLGHDKCLGSLLNTPGNFTASKLKWVKDNQPEVYAKIDKIMLPGDYIAMKLTDEINTTVSGLSEGMFWDFSTNSLSEMVMNHYGFDKSLIPAIVPTFAVQGLVTPKAAAELGIEPGIPVSYRAGDQPNNALSLNVLEAGDVAATGGTSGVVYGVSDVVRYDPESRVNTFAHVNHTTEQNRLGVLLCINGTGILNSWLHKNVGGGTVSYQDMDKMAMSVEPGAEGLSVLPFGNGAERVLRNKETGAWVAGLNFNTHSSAHLYRAAQEGIVYSFKYGMDIMKQTGIEPKVIRAGKANMFLSPLFRECLATVSDTPIQLYNTDGAQGAARGAGIGCGFYASAKEAFEGLQVVDIQEPNSAKATKYKEAYQNWLVLLNKSL